MILCINSQEQRNSTRCREMKVQQRVSTGHFSFAIGMGWATGGAGGFLGCLGEDGGIIRSEPKGAFGNAVFPQAQGVTGFEFWAFR